MDGESFGSALRRLRRARGLSLRALAARVYLSHGYLHQFEHGRPVSEEHARRLDDALDARGELIALASKERTDGDYPERLAHAVAHPARVDSGALEALAAMLAAQRRLEDALGSEAIVAAVQENLDVAERIAREAPDHLRRRAVGLLSEYAQFRGWLAIPMGRWADAQRWTDRAIVAGIEAGDRVRTATALSFSAYRHLVVARSGGGSAMAALGLNEAALAYGRDIPGLGLQIRYQHAEILARTGDRRRAVAMVAEADAAVDSLDVEDLPSSGYWYTPAFFLGSKAIVLHYLDDPAAPRMMVESLSAMPREWRDSEWAAYRRSLVEG